MFHSKYHQAILGPLHLAKLLALILVLPYATTPAHCQTLEQTVRQRLDSYFSHYQSPYTELGTCRVDSIQLDMEVRHLTVYASDHFAYQPFRPAQVAQIYNQVKSILPGPVRYFEIELHADGKRIDELVPNYFRDKRRDKNRLQQDLPDDTAPWVTRTRPYRVRHGLEGCHIALWASHGQYYDNRKKCWKWQRPRLFGTTEDLYTPSLIVPYLIPMLENAGAYAISPRERDTQRHEVVVDNDDKHSASTYVEQAGRRISWLTVPQPGFAWKQATYANGESPFGTGTARYAHTGRRRNHAFAEWIPRLPQKGSYAVYVTYQTLPQSIDDARYLVFHNGGVTEFKVNQQIGGGTWVYLGTFEFDAGQHDHCMVVLTNESHSQGVVCADAVRFGGGIGNISRDGQTSGLPRYLEGARYWTQWAGMPPEVYNGYHGENDYADDINARSRMLNYLSGGSTYNPRQTGLGVPIALSVALHTDAGYNLDDKIIGTLGIYTTRAGDKLLAAGTDRYASRDLADLILTQLQKDISTEFRTSWTRRSLWNRNYSETRLPAVPSVIIELLSHQNFSDLRLGHDPNFKFVAARAIYKAILRHMATQHQRRYTIQPLPVTHFAINFGKRNHTLELSWRPQTDINEPTAEAKEYIIYTRIGQGGFDNGKRVKKTSYKISIEPGIVYSFKVCAINDGGESFPSEVLSAYWSPDEQARIMIVNGFDRVCGPAVLNDSTASGFDLRLSPGIPRHKDMALCGLQYDYNRQKAGKSWGESGPEYEGMQIAGNSFNYPYIHGTSIRAARHYSFVSCSDEAVEDGLVTLENYDVMDYILGMEQHNPADHPIPGDYYKTFSTAMQRAISSFCHSGGKVMVSGAFLGSDMQAQPADRQFAQDILKYNFGTTLHPTSDLWTIQGVGQSIQLPSQANEEIYAVYATDQIVPVSGSFTAMVHADSQKSAAVAYDGPDYRTFVMGFPFEAIRNKTAQSQLMASILRFLLK